MRFLKQCDNNTLLIALVAVNVVLLSLFFILHPFDGSKDDLIPVRERELDNGILPDRYSYPHKLDDSILEQTKIKQRLMETPLIRVHRTEVPIVSLAKEQTNGEDEVTGEDVKKNKESQQPRVVRETSQSKPDQQKQDENKWKQEPLQGHRESVTERAKNQSIPMRKLHMILPSDDWRHWKDRSGHWAPIVDEEHKLIVCTITKAACTMWRKFMRRLKGFSNWDTSDERITHNYGGKSSGLKYLSDYSEEQAEKLMRDPSYFKAAIVRNPLTRVLSAWKDKFGPDSVHNWGQIEWDTFAINKVHPGCKGDEHWMQQSCFCGLRHWDYDYIAHMEGNSMQELAKEMASRGHVTKEFITTGWGKSQREAFLQSNTVFHRTGISSQAADYYSVKNHPNVLSHVLHAHKEDIVRFGYQEDVRQLYNKAYDS